MATMNMVQALNQALREEMARDARVLVLGEDVGKNGGVFRVTDGLFDEFGPDRAIDTPLAESGIIGTSIGLALYGFRPVPEIQFDGFTYPALDQIMNHLGRLRYRSRGQMPAPVVVRFPYGGGVRSPEHHSDSPETFYVHSPGLKVVVPATPSDAKGLLISAIRDPDPVIFMEPKRAYRTVKEEVPENDHVVPLGKARVARSGSDVTVISYGAMLHVSLRAAKNAQEENIDVEVLDLRTLYPLDTDAVLQSVEKTGRVVVVHEAPLSNGFGGELVALIAERALLSLEAPPKRVAGADIPFPPVTLEEYYVPNPHTVLSAIREVAHFS